MIPFALGQLTFNVSTDLPTGEIYFGVGGDREITCDVRDNGSRLDAIWFLNRGENDKLIRNGSIESTETTVVIGGEYRSTLRLTNVSSDLAGAQIRCGTITTMGQNLQPKPFPVLTILRKF